MVIDMGYWTRVIKKIIILLFTILGLYLAFKLAIFYTPFLIAFIFSLMIEPIIKWVNKKTKFTRKISAILVLVFVSCLVIGLLIWGITSLISESAHLLSGLNRICRKTLYKNTIYHK